MKQKGFTLIELLVVVAIIGILAAVGVVAYSGYTSGAKKSAAISNHKAISKYIVNEVMKCTIGESKAMSGNLDCSKKGTYNWADDVTNAAIKTLSDFKNPYDTNSTTPMTLGGAYWYDNHVGFIRIHASSHGIVQVYVCAATPCTGTPNANIYDSGPIDVNQ
jgi:type IV pilus assembly protein PilA